MKLIKILTACFLSSCSLFGSHLQAAIINVSGGGSQLQTAIAGAAADDEIVVTDSLNYGDVVVNKKLTIRAATGQTPTVLANGLTTATEAVSFSGPGLGSTWRGINIRNSNVPASYSTLVNIASGGAVGDKVTIENCTISIVGPGATTLPQAMVMAQSLVEMSTCTLTRNDAKAEGMLLWILPSGNYKFTNCTFGPSTVRYGIYQWASLMTCDRSTFTNIEGEAVYSVHVPATHTFTQCTFNNVYAFRPGNSDPAPIYNIDRCVFYQRPGFFIAADGTTRPNTQMNITNSALLLKNSSPFYIATGAWNVALKHCTVATDPGYAGTDLVKLFLVFNTQTDPALFDIQNCIFNLPGRALDVVADETTGGPTPQVTAGTNLINANGGTGGLDPFIGVGTQITGDPLLAADAYHLTSNSTLADNAGLPVGIMVDIDGDGRSPSVPDLGADEGTPVIVPNAARHWILLE